MRHSVRVPVRQSCSPSAYRPPQNVTEASFLRRPAPTKEPSRGGLFLVTVILRLGCLLLLNRWLRQLQSLGLVTPCPCWLQLALLYQTGPGVFDWANRDSALVPLASCIVAAIQSRAICRSRSRIT